jgi:hypothetical protein
MKNYVSILFVLGLFYSCQLHNDEKKVTEKKNIEVDSTFHFIVRVDGDSINSKTGTFTRQYTKGSKSIHFELTKTEFKNIKTLYFEEKLDTLPNNFILNCQIYLTGTTEDEFVIHFDGKQKKFYYNSYYECVDKKSEKIFRSIERFRNYVHKIIIEKEEIDKLDKTDIGLPSGDFF